MNFRNYIKEVAEINEELQYIKFSYKSENSNDPKPKVAVLDFVYPGRAGQKTYGQREDLLGFNLNYAPDKKYAKRALDEIDTFARLISAGKKEKWERIADFFPDAKEFVRRYKRENMKAIKRKDGWFWKKANFDDLIKFDKESV